MKTRQPMLSWFGCALLLSLLPAISRAEVTLVKDGQTQAAIYVDAAVLEKIEKPIVGGLWRKHGAVVDHQRLQASVNDLSHYLEKISGAKIEVVAGPPKSSDKRLPILIGELAAKKFGPPKKSATLKQGFRVVIGPQGVGLFGESPLSTSYAIYELLDRLGCRWYMPSEMGEVIPAKKTITMAQSDVSDAPYTIYRGIWYADADYGRRNRLGGLELSAGHALEGYISKEDREKHPEWIGTHDGKPHGRRLKWSAPGLPEAMAKAILTKLEKNPETLSVSLSPDDGLGYDNSAEDNALDAGDFDPSVQDMSLTDRSVWLSNRIVAPVAKKHPEVLFGMLAYGQMTRPPVREKLHPNIIPQVAPITYARNHPMTDDGEPNNKHFRALVEGWGKASKRVSYYFYGFHLAEPAAPNPFITKWGVNVPMAFKHNCRLWQPETITNFETAMHAHYLGMRLAWNPDQQPKDIFAELHKNFYGHAAKEMAAYWHHVDQLWHGTPDYTGCGFGYLRRFSPERVAQMRSLMDEAIKAAQSPAEKFRVGMANDSLILFELFMKLRRDLAERRFEHLSKEAQAYRDMAIALGNKYEKQYAFGKMGWTRGDTLYGRYFGAFYQKTYTDASRVASDFLVLKVPDLAKLRYQVDKKKQGEAAGWATEKFDDAAWKLTDPTAESWSALGYHNYMGSMWYRKRVRLPKVPAGKKVFLWIGATDGSAKVFINGKHVPYVNDKGETSEAFAGYCQPGSVDITTAIRPDAENQIALFCTRTFINELGTGGLLAPLAIYREKD